MRIVNNSSPLISVIMPVYNAEKFLKPAIESILNQTFSDFELIIIDDNSNDKTADIIKSYNDNRIKHIVNPNRIGFTNSLNQGLKIAQGDYIARMDADDISDPERFSKEIEFLENNPDIGVCGSWMKIIDENGKIINKIQLPVGSNVIAWRLYFNNCVAHPSVILRRKVIDRVNYYNSDFVVAEDYDLWNRIIKISKIENIPEYLLKYRIHGKNISLNREKVLTNDYLIRKNAIQNLIKRQLNSSEDNAFREWIYQFPKKYPKDILIIKDLILEMYLQYGISNKLNKRQLNEINQYTALVLINFGLLIKTISPKISILCLLTAAKFYPLIFLKMIKDRFSRKTNPS